MNIIVCTLYLYKLLEGSRKKKERELEGEERETSVKTNGGGWSGLCRLQVNVPASAQQL